MNKEKLRERCYEMGNSQFPIDKFYNDIDEFYNAIRDDPNFDKESAFLDLEKIVNHIEKLEKENKELRKSIKSWNENGGNLLKENIELKNTIKILKDKIELPLENDFDVVNKDDIHLYRLRTKCLINEEEYELLKEVLKQNGR